MNAEGGFPVQPGLLTGVMADNHLNESLAIELLQPERVEDLHFFLYIQTSKASPLRKVNDFLETHSGPKKLGCDFDSDSQNTSSHP